MEYAIHQLAQLSGVSTRTLRYYDEMGLLHPARVSEAGYRYYGEKEVALLQQILFYRERGLELKVIREILHRPDFDLEQALEDHLKALCLQQQRLSLLIRTVNLTLQHLKGEGTMEDHMKFEAFKKNVVAEKEAAYGAEARKAYGDEAVDQSNQKILQMSQGDYERFQFLGQEILRQLEEAVKAGEDPHGPVGKRIVALHKEWLGFTWKEYSAQAHQGVAQLYVQDPRFQAYYDRNVAGCAQFLTQAVDHWIK